MFRNKLVRRYEDLFIVFDIPIVRIFFSDDTHTVFFRDLSADVISEVTNRIEADHRAPRDILQSFGITGYYRGFRGIFKLFPDTPVKLLRDVCEVLQLYDLVDLLQKPVQPKPHVTKSLRPVLTLDEVRELGKSDARPISYHSRAAVLIFVESENDSNVKSYESFFKSLNNNSEVIIIQCDGIMKLMKERRELQFRPLADATARFRGIPSWYTQKRLEKELAEIKAKQRKEEENVETAASTVVDRWIQHQGWYKWQKGGGWGARVCCLTRRKIQRLCVKTPTDSISFFWDGILTVLITTDYCDSL